MNHHLRVARLAAAGLVVGVLAACGSSSAKSSTTTSQPSQKPSTSSSAPKSSGISIKDFAFHPDTLSVRSGETVTVKNDDSTTHTLTADDAAFDAGNLTAGSSKTFTAPKPGTYKFHCNFHANMHGTLTVT